MGRRHCTCLFVVCVYAYTWLINKKWIFWVNQIELSIIQKLMTLLGFQPRSQFLSPPVVAFLSINPSIKHSPSFSLMPSLSLFPLFHFLFSTVSPSLFFPFPSYFLLVSFASYLVLLFLSCNLNCLWITSFIHSFFLSQCEHMGKGLPASTLITHTDWLSTTSWASSIAV